MDRQRLIHAQNVADKMLLGSTLDSFRVYSVVLDMHFLNLRAEKTSPNEIWVNSTGQTEILAPKKSSANFETETRTYDFSQSRAALLAQLYQLIGSKVSAVDIDPSGAFEICFEHATIAIAGDSTDLEEIWAITSDNPEPYGDQAWSVVLTDRREIYAKAP